jgi:thiamine pyrophosphokinase
MNFERIVFLLNGPLNAERVALSKPELEQGSASHLFCVDGGVRHLPHLSLGAPPFTWVGDADSTPSDHVVLHKEKVPPGPQGQRTITLPTVKDLSDFAAALDRLAADGFTETPLLLEVLCGLGGSRSHEEANLREAARFLTGRSVPTVVLFQPAVILTNCPIEVPLAQGSLFSLFAVDQMAEAAVLIEGADYHGLQRLKRPSHGLNNRTTTDRLAVAPEAGSALILFLERPPSLSP